MYQKVAHAWVVLDVNLISRLYVMFEEHPIEADHNGGFTRMDSTKPFCEVFPNGIVKRASCSTINPVDYYKTRYCTEAGDRIDAVAVYEIVPAVPPHTRWYNNATNEILITKDFAEQILKEFNLPFRCVKGNDYIHDDGMTLVQDNADALVGTMIPTIDYGHAYVLEHMLGDVNGVMNNEWFKVRIANGEIRYLKYDRLLGVYKGLIMSQFRTQLNLLGSE